VKLSEFRVQFFLTGLFVVQFVFLLVGSIRSGISVDEQIHTSDLYGQQSAADPDHWHFGVYGLSFQLLGNSVNFLVGNEALLKPELSVESYLVRHLMIALLATLTAIVVGGIVWVITNQKLIALWGAVATSAMPVFMGHGFFNPKDLPVAFGYTLVTFSCIASLVVSKRQVHQKSQLILIAGASVFGFWIAAGTRLIFLWPFVLTVVVTVVLMIFARKLGKKTTTSWNSSLALVFGSFAGILTILITHPCVIADRSRRCDLGPNAFFGGAISNLEFPSGAPTPVFGYMVSGESPEFWFLPVGIWATTPLLIGILAFIGFFFYWEKTAIMHTGLSGTQYGKRFTLISMGVIVSMQAFLVPILTLLSRGHTYLRHHLYVYPALAVLAACGLALSLQFVRRFKSGFIELCVKSIAVVAVLVPLVEGIFLFPYNYVYVNPVAGLNGYSNRWETDYWATSLREAVESLPTDQDAFVYRWPQTIAPFVQDLIPATANDFQEVDTVAVLFPRVIGLNWSENQPGCAPSESVTRSFRGETLIMSSILLCDPKVLITNNSAGSFFKFKRL
jgi:hypothetical protein